MQQTIKWFRFASATLLCLLVITQLHAATTLPKGIIKLDGRQTPPLSLKNLDAETYNLAESKGKWVFLHFWASWCGPCIKEMPTIQAITSDFENTHLEIILVNTAEDEDTIFSFMSTVAPDLNTLMDPDGLTTEDWQPRGLPSTYFVDPQGKLQYVALGGRPWDEGEYLAFLKGLSP
jgi:thiol-disulfide isomerase/thioredoxin